MTRLFRHTYWSRSASAGGDVVVSAADIPNESTLNQTFGEAHNRWPSTPVASPVLYGMFGQVIPHSDPEQADPYEDMWDKYVDKAEDASVTSLWISTGSAASAPVFEPGEMNWEDLTDLAVVSDESEFLAYRKMLSFANSPIGFESGAPDTYYPADIVSLNRRKSRIRNGLYSAAITVISVPSMDDTSTALYSPVTNDSDWLFLKYASLTMKQAWMYLSGVTETGAESPYEDAALFMEEYLSPPVYEGVGYEFNSTTALIAGTMTYDVSVPGDKHFGTISGQT